MQLLQLWEIMLSCGEVRYISASQLGHQLGHRDLGSSFLGSLPRSNISASQLIIWLSSGEVLSMQEVGLISLHHNLAMAWQW